jgi:hypothetical protein
VVYPNGPKKPGLCVQCALARGGVRSTAASHPAISKRELKKRLKERKEEDKALARLARDPVPIPPISNPFTPGWAFGDDDLPGAEAPTSPAGAPASPFTAFAEAVAASEPAPDPEPARVASLPPPPIDTTPRAPTLADLLPTITPQESPPAALADLATNEADADESERRPWSLPILRRREPEAEETARESSEMIAWLDEVFAPKSDQ